MKNFLKYAYEVIWKSFERYLYQIQRKESLRQEEKVKEKKQKKYQNEPNAQGKLRSILQDSESNIINLPKINGL